MYTGNNSPLFENYIMGDEITGQKMTGLHGRISKSREDTLNTNGGKLYYGYDGLGTVTEMYDHHGDAVESYRYDSFGNIFTGITVPYNMKSYTGQIYDEKASLMYMNARWYDSEVGRFISEDSYQGTTSNSQSLNRYSYVMNDPVNYTDPSGHLPSWVGSSHYYKTYKDTSHVDYEYRLKSKDKDTGNWVLTSSQKSSDNRTLTRYYSRTVKETWVYTYTNFHYKYDSETDSYKKDGSDTSTKTYTDTDHQTKSEVFTAKDIAAENTATRTNYLDTSTEVTYELSGISIEHSHVGTVQTDDGDVEIWTGEDTLSETEGEEGIQLSDNELLALLYSVEDDIIEMLSALDIENATQPILTDKLVISDYINRISYNSLDDLSAIPSDGEQDETKILDLLKTITNYSTGAINGAVDTYTLGLTSLIRGDQENPLVTNQEQYETSYDIGSKVVLVIGLAALGIDLTKFITSVAKNGFNFALNFSDDLLRAGEGTSDLVLKGTNYSAEYAQKLQNTYKVFKGNGYEIGEHGLNRIFGRINQGKIQSVDQVFDVLETGAKYSDTVNGGTVLFKDGVSIHIAEDGFIKSVIGNAKVKETWELLK